MIAEEHGSCEHDHAVTVVPMFLYTNILLLLLLPEQTVITKISYAVFGCLCLSDTNTVILEKYMDVPVSANMCYSTLCKCTDVVIYSCSLTLSPTGGVLIL